MMDSGFYYEAIFFIISIREMMKTKNPNNPACPMKFVKRRARLISSGLILSKRSVMMPETRHP